MTRLYLSSPIVGKTDEEVRAVMKRATQSAEAVLNEGGYVKIVNGVFGAFPVDMPPLWYLAESLKGLAIADIAYFDVGWDSVGRCRVEHLCAVEYGIPIIEEEQNGTIRNSRPNEQ